MLLITEKTRLSLLILWTGTDGLEKLFGAFFLADPVEETCYMLDARVYDITEEWMNFYGDFGIKGELGTCFKMNEIKMANNEGDMIVLENIRLATFVDTAWKDCAANDDCFD
jgi:hypothetical protein